MKKTYTLEYLNEDAEIAVIIFDDTGIKDQFVSQGIRGKYDEPDFNQVYINEVGDGYDDPEVGTGSWMQIVESFHTFEDSENDIELPAYTYVADLTADDYKELYKYVETNDKNN